MTRHADLLSDVSWSCVGLPPESVTDPAALTDDAPWLPVAVPGTAAGALRDAGQWQLGMEDECLLDGQDWWFRCRFEAAPGDHVLALDGLATLADVWLNGLHLLRSENMFLAHRLPVEITAPDNELVIRCAALTPQLARRRPRPRWRSLLVRSQNLRWFRTTLLGRIPGWSRSGAPVGPWRPVRLWPREELEVLDRGLSIECDGSAAAVTARVVVEAANPISHAALRVGDQVADLAVAAGADGAAVLTGRLDVQRPQLWWPTGHGDQPLYPVSLDLDGVTVDLGKVGLRNVSVDRTNDGFTLVVNGARVFARGACWVNPDTIGHSDDPSALRASLTRFVEAGLTLLRVGGYLTYETATFWDLCDELGILVWQDVMLAGIDPPEDEEYLTSLTAEVRQLAGGLRGRPSLAVMCGDSESYQQAAMWGTPPQTWHSDVLETIIPAVITETLPGIPYVASSPSGGDLPFSPDTGVAHYFGVGAYLRPPADVRTAGVRFAAECLAFATPPESAAVEAWFGGAAAAGHSPQWKAGVARDSRTSWDFEDVVTHYVRELFDVDPMLVRYTDPERSLDLCRAAVLELMSLTMRAWRDPRSSCAGAVVLCWQDIARGAGWGLLDAAGDPKAPWYELRRLCGPRAVFFTDDGVAGLHAHVVNDSPHALSGHLEIATWTSSGDVSEQVEVAVSVEPRSAARWSADRELGGFRDLTRAYRFGPPQHDAVTARLVLDGAVVSEDLFLPSGCARPQRPDIGLRAELAPGPDTGWTLDITTNELAQRVAVDAPGWRCSDSWFHLAAGGRRRVELSGGLQGGPPQVSVRALNAVGTILATAVDSRSIDG